MRSKLMIAALALSTASFTFAAKKPKTETTPAATDPATTQTTDAAKKTKNKKHKEHHTETKPTTK